jgi:hypothetical protein
LSAATTLAGILVESTFSPSERRLRAHARPDAPVLRAGDRLVQLERAAPELLVAERVVAEDLTSLGEEGGGVALVHVDRALLRRECAHRPVEDHSAEEQQRGDARHRSDQADATSCECHAGLPVEFHDPVGDASPPVLTARVTAITDPGPFGDDGHIGGGAA